MNKIQNAQNNFLLGDEPHQVYLANPLGFTESGRRMIQEIILPEFARNGVLVYEPFREFHARALKKYWNFDLSNHEIALYAAECNCNAVRTAKVVLAILDGVDVDSGTASEVGYKYGIGWGPIIGIRSDFRWNSADAAAVKVNLQVEGFIHNSGGAIYPTYEGGIEAAIRAVRPEFSRMH